MSGVELLRPAPTSGDTFAPVGLAGIVDALVGVGPRGDTGFLTWPGSVYGRVEFMRGAGWSEWS